jgi:hypothetical protein
MFTLLTKCPCLSGKNEHDLQYYTELGISETLIVHGMVLTFYQFFSLTEFNLANLDTMYKLQKFKFFTTRISHGTI